MRLINILGIKINVFSKKEALAKIEKLLDSENQHYLVTPNPEIILTAIKHDEEFFYILNRADLYLPDGFGLKIAGWFMGVNLTRITGADLVKDILELAEKQNKKITILNWKNGLSNAQDITISLTKKYPKLKFIVQDIDREDNNCSVASQDDRLVQFQPEIIFCTLGAPYQEKFIFHNLKNLPSVKIGIGVGGAFDFLTKKIKRAPKLFRIIGLEWLWRLIKQPWRWKRIYNAVVIFSIKFFLWRFVLPFFYRPNVVCMLYKKYNSANPPYQEDSTQEEKIKYKILIVERANEKNHWQLPQGGTDGQNLTKAGKRELIEELNINDNQFKKIAIFPKLHVYEFGKEISKFNVLSKDVCGYKGQKQGLFIAEFLGQDEDRKINFWEHSAWRWVDSSELIDQVYLSRKPATKIFLEKFNQITEHSL
ncbi:WecB/TagA/CpsF family glycosyltransferase [Patescibacteria group bacterium]|nr:WecB/TagA/CpsF family glycosyltransferase [Patescibacteria group bacterium]MBU0879229.1 WecB/TagA/CpsF family glycosyltransferase [Patescibacteria group bacterium]MBU0880041.1 WecB/TagA/CpsF family glycosyltransferase [Patescibacteria group bacterium]MBU0898003.1 WecB/TagA/CpsF family glycosyltransferase [Patescibacteria group bacterium]MBU1783555.1 WecB/TagA/CpsF family glycosyltransferase [Patescibacteria group bacterium]